MIILFLVFLGLCLGSFVNALVWRLHEKAKKGSSSNLSIWQGRSMCPNCRHVLSGLDLIPVLSWLWLGGKCRYCHKPISSQYPLVEALTAAAFIFSYIYWPATLTGREVALFGFWLVFLVGFMALAVYDLRWMKLPDKIVFPLIGLALTQAVLLLASDNFVNRLTSLVISVVVGGGIFYAIFQISQAKWIGGGDVKLGFLLGLVLADGGLMVLAIFIASILGTFISIPLMVSGKANRQTRIPFGPFLILGTIIAKLFGAAVINWYKRQLIS